LHSLGDPVDYYPARGEARGGEICTAACNHLKKC
jgi:hypothetical protein